MEKIFEKDRDWYDYFVDRNHHEFVRNFLANNNEEACDALIRRIESSFICLFNSGSYYGWLLPDGTVYYCAYGAHDYILEYMNISRKEAELQGWVHFSKFEYIATQKLTHKQRKFLKGYNDYLGIQNIRI